MLPMPGETLVIQRGDTYIKTIDWLGDLTDRAKIWFTVKSDTALLDNQATIMLTDVGGLLIVNGVAWTVPADGTLTVVNAAAGIVTIALKPAVTKLLERRGMYYDLQKVTAAGVVKTLTQGQMVVNYDVTRAIT